MRVRRLHIQRLPGIPAPGFSLEELTPGINVVVGPNASGKTSLLRAFGAALYGGQLRNHSVVVEAELVTKDGTLRALRAGNEIAWQLDGKAVDPPTLPEERFLPCFTLRLEDLLEEDGQTDRGIAERINRELAGGYDLARARQESGFKLGANHGRSEAAELREADSALRQVQREHEELRREEERIPGLEKAKAEAKEAEWEAAALHAALALLDARRRRLGREARLALFPAGMDGLHGNEGQRLDDLRQQRRQLDEVDIATARAARKQAEETLRESGLGASNLDEATLTDRRTQVNRLRAIEAEIVSRRNALVEAEADQGRALNDLGGTASQEPVALKPDDVRTTETALTESRALKAELRALEAELARLPPLDQAEPDTQRLDEARRELIRWLSVPRNHKWTVVRIVAASLLLAAGVAGVILGAAIAHPGLLALFLPLGWAAYVLLLRRGPAEEECRQAEARFRSAAVDKPPSWEPQQVQAHLWSLDRRLTEARILEERIARRQSVEAERQSHDANLAGALAALREVAQRVNYDPMLLDVSFDRWLRLVAAYERADGTCRQIRSASAAREDEARKVRESLVRFLSAYDEAPDDERPDAEMLGHRLERLAGRVRTRDAARRDLNSADDRIKELTGQVERNERDIAKLFTDLDLEEGDGTGLRDRLERLAEWRELRQELLEARGAEAERQQALEQREELLALIEADDESAIQSALAERQAAADRIPAVDREITEISTRIAEAKRRRSLESARARRQLAADASRVALEEALFAEAGALLLDQVEAEHVRASRPAVLRRAEDWFARFTRHQCELDFQPDGGGIFAARETATQERRSLAQLSSGTRMQLLLAVRVAFALEAERGREPLPLFLDEALTTADPERFQAAAASLARLADEQERQIIYLTAQPVDVAFWQASGNQPTCIDLMECRTGGQAIASAREIVLPPAAPEPPEPGSMSAEDYAVAIGVSPIAPWGPTSGIHLFHLLRDDLGLLWRLLRAGVDRIGPLDSLLRSAEADLVLAPDDQRRLRRRSAGTDAWIEAWRYGRGRPVDRDVLEASGAVSSTFVDRVAALAEELQGDGHCLMERLKGGSVHRFRSSSAEALERWLAENGYVDTTELLDSAALERRTASAMALHFDDAEDGKAEARELARSLAAGVTAASALRDSEEEPGPPGR